MSISDFRSDTVTRPDDEMRRVMASAKVGDDVLGDDPTVKKLEKMAAEIFDRESALFVPSGTMANQICCFCHTQPGDEVIVDVFSHLYNFEVAGLAVLARVQARPLTSQAGVLTPQQIEEVIRPAGLHLPNTGLIALENTHNMAGGRIFPLATLKEIRVMADEYHLKIHIDGARIFNAALASGTDPKEYGKIGHSLSFCVSKGLGAPVGSLIVSDGPFIQQARRIRKMLGGGMRQVGILASAAILAIERRGELARDHQLARELARELNRVAGLSVDLSAVETNIVMVDFQSPSDPAQFVAFLEEMGILSIQINPSRVRFVTHRDVGPEDLQRLSQALSEYSEKAT